MIANYGLLQLTVLQLLRIDPLRESRLLRKSDHLFEEGARSPQMGTKSCCLFILLNEVVFAPGCLSHCFCA